MFDQVRQPLALGVECLSGQGLAVVSWRGWYSLYLALEGWIDRAGQAVSALEQDARDAEACNDAFVTLQQDSLSLFRSLFGLMRQGGARRPDADPRAVCLYRQCHPKSAWMHDLELETGLWVGATNRDGLASAVQQARSSLHGVIEVCEQLRGLLRDRCTIDDLVP
jgi:hypothetical protein